MTRAKLSRGVKDSAKLAYAGRRNGTHAILLGLSLGECLGKDGNYWAWLDLAWGSAHPRVLTVCMYACYHIATSTEHLTLSSANP